MWCELKCFEATSKNDQSNLIQAEHMLGFE